jgi:hypothetical protein
MSKCREGTIKNGQSRETGNIRYGTQDQKTKNKKNTTQYVLDPSLSKQTQISYIRHEPFYKHVG